MREQMRNEHPALLDRDYQSKKKKESMTGSTH